MKKVLFLILSIFLINTAVYAGSGKIQFSDHKNITRGNSVTVTLKVKSTDVNLQSAEIELSYDTRALEFENGSEGVEGSNGYIKVVGKGKGSKSRELEYSIKFKTLLAGTTYITCTSNKVTDRNNNTVNITGVGQSKIVVTPKNKSSRNANLSALAISPGELDKTFTAEELNYKTEVNADTEEITVFPIPEDADASYVISGNTQLVTGPNNNITIVVTAPNGSTKKTYTISVEKLDYGVAVGDNVISGEKISAQPITITVREKPEDVAIPSGFVEGYLNIGATPVAGFVPSGENNGEPTYGLIYAANRNGEEYFYKYDKEDGTIQKYIADPNTKSLEDTQKRLKNSNDAYERLRKVYNIILPVAIGLGVLVVVLIILLAIGSKGKGGNKNRFEDDFDDDDDDYFIRKPERKEKIDDADYDDIDDDDIEDLG